MGATDAKRWKVGEVAKATGLTVRALHHYDELGLLVPSERTPAGHRLYAEGDLRRLYRILALRQVRLPLTEIDSVIDDEGPGLIETVRRHLERVDRDLERGQRLRRSLVRILDALERSLEPSIDQFIDAMEAMTVIETTVADVLLLIPSEDLDADAHIRFLPNRPRVVLLKESDGERMLPIWTAFPEADVLAAQLGGRIAPRPPTPELTVRLLEAAGASVERVVIESVSKNTYFATVTLTAGATSHEIDARPSDALNLAARTGAAVFVDQKVMDDHGVASLAHMESRLLAQAETEIREGSPSVDTEKTLPAERPGGSGEWQSLIARVRSGSTSEHPAAE